MARAVGRDQGTSSCRNSFCWTTQPSRLPVARREPRRAAPRRTAGVLRARRSPHRMATDHVRWIPTPGRLGHPAGSSQDGDRRSRSTLNSIRASAERWRPIAGSAGGSPPLEARTVHSRALLGLGLRSVTNLHRGQRDARPLAHGSELWSKSVAKQSGGAGLPGGWQSARSDCLYEIGKGTCCNHRIPRDQP